VNADPKCCPDSKCKFGTGKPVGFFRRRGSYFTKCRPTPTHRFQCKGCGKVFSSQSSAPSLYQRRPDINAVLARMLCEGVTLRGCARVLGCPYDTVKSKADWLAIQAREAHQRALKSGRLNTSWRQLDEMMTFEHARARTLTIPLVVRGKTAEILVMTVGRIPSSGHLATKGKTMYGWTVNEVPAACRKALSKHP